MSPKSFVGQGWCHKCGQPVHSQFPRYCPADRGDCMPTLRTRPKGPMSDEEADAYLRDEQPSREVRK